VSEATFPLKLPTSIKTAAARLAKEDGVNLNQRVATAVARNVGAVETAAAFFKRRAAGHSLDEVDDILAGCRIVRRSRATSCPRSGHQVCATAGELAVGTHAPAAKEAPPLPDGRGFSRAGPNALRVPAPADSKALRGDRGSGAAGRPRAGGLGRQSKRGAGRTGFRDQA
jgi:hypothetical protein